VLLDVVDDLSADMLVADSNREAWALTRTADFAADTVLTERLVQ